MDNNNKYFELVANEKLLVKATIESKIDIFSSLDYHFITSLKTKYDFGGSRIAISKDSKLLFCCGYYYGIQAINIESKKIIWKNSKIKFIQRIKVSNDGAYIFLSTETKKLYIIESNSGLIISKENGIINFYKTTLNELIISKKNSLYLKSEESINFITTLENPVLTTCSLQNNIVISEMHKSLRKVNIHSGKDVWVSNLKPGFRINHMAIINDKTIVMIGFYNASSTEDQNYLFILNTENGEILKKTQIDSKYHGFCFSHDGHKLYCSNGDVFDTIAHEKIVKNC
jgi:outer membrane protein assembly factor BamB